MSGQGEVAGPDPLGQPSRRDPAPPGARPHRMRVLWRAGAATVVVALLLGGGWLAAERLQSPAQRAAAAQAPSPGPVTAQVSSGVLRELISAQATVTAVVQQATKLPQQASFAVVTKVLAAGGTTVGAGDPLVAVNDRPVLVMPGAFEYYRDIGEGDTGADVRQLQDGLRAAGYFITPRENGTFGPRTAAAVRRLYAHAGFTVPQQTSADPASGARAPAAATSTPSDASSTSSTSSTGASATRIVVPRSELLVVTGTLPTTVGTVPGVGVVLSDQTSSVSFVGAGTAVHADVAASIAATLEPGTAGYLQGAAGVRVQVKVASIDDGNTTTGVSPSVALTPTGPDGIPATWTGTQVLAVIALDTVAGESLIVPSRAVAVSGESAKVAKQGPDGSFRLVDVEDLGDLNGQSAVRPVTKGELVVGDLVQVG